MNIGDEKELSFSDFISAAFEAWGPRRAEKLLHLAIHARMIALRAQRPVLIPFAEGITHE